jgi:hypothetical protein
MFVVQQQSIHLLFMQDEVGAAGLTTVSNASFFGTTRLIGNEWGALQTKYAHACEQLFSGLFMGQCGSPC